MRIIYDGGLILLASYLPICRWQILSSGKKSETKKTETDGGIQMLGIYQTPPGQLHE
jgi:hypothetical protein